MRSLALTFLFSILFAHLLMGQRLNFCKGLIGTGTATLQHLSPGSSNCSGIAIDAEKNIYIAGTENDSVDFDPGIANYYLRGGEDDVYFAKYDSSGNLLWANVLTSAGGNYAIDIALDHQENIIIAGYCTNQADFDPSAGVYILPRNGNNQYSFFAKYTKDGNFIWAKDISGVNGTSLFDMSIDPQNHIYLTGNFYDAIDCDPSSGQAMVSSFGSGIFFASYDENGNYINAKSLSAIGNYGGASSIYSDEIGNIYLTGFFGGTVDFDPGAATYMITATSNAELFFAKFDTNFNFKWAKNIDTHENFFAAGRTLKLTVNSQQQIFLTGQYYGNVDFDPGPGTYFENGGNYTSGFIASYDSAGSFRKVASLLGSCFTTDITIDCSDNIFITGDFSRVDFDPGFNDYTLTTNAPSAFQIFLAKYDSSIALRWVKQFGNDGYGGSINGRPKIVLDEKGHQYIGGNFKQTADFDPDSGHVTLTQGGVGMNSFFAKFSPNWKSTDLSDSILCVTVYSFFFVNDSSQYDEIRWNFGDQSPEQQGNFIAHHFLQSGTYSIHAYLNNGCTTDTISKQILIPEAPEIELKDQTICPGEKIMLNAEVINGTYHWQNGSTQPYFIVNQAGIYWVEVMQYNCYATDTAVIDTMDCTTTLIMPNVFTPNQDGKNDIFLPKEMHNIHSPEMEIFNRWGNKIFETSDVRWNGKNNNEICSSGTYFWIVRYKDEQGKPEEKKGFVMLIGE